MARKLETEKAEELILNTDCKVKDLFLRSNIWIHAEFHTEGWLACEVEEAFC